MINSDSDNGAEEGSQPANKTRSPDEKNSRKRRPAFDSDSSQDSVDHSDGEKHPMRSTEDTSTHVNEDVTQSDSEDEPLRSKKPNKKRCHIVESSDESG